MALTRRTFLQAGGLAALTVLTGGSAALLSGCEFTTGTMRSLTDMYGRTVNAPATIERVFCSNPIGTSDLYMLAPNCLVGWNFRPSGANKQFIPDEYFSLPSLGVWMGAGSVPSSEEIAAQNPDVILCFWTNDDVGAKMADGIRDETGLPVLLVDYDLRSAAESFRFVGGLIGAEERAEELAVYCESRLQLIEQTVACISQLEHKRIYLAQGISGLTTDPVGSMHVSDALDLLALQNVADMPGTEGQGMGMPTVNLEQIISWDPDAVLVAEYSMSDMASSDTYEEIKNDKDWNNVPCVKAGELYRIPQYPFSWFGRPPSAMRLLGCLWLIKILYPDYSGSIDLAQEARDFYRVFLRYDLTEADLISILTTAGIDPTTGAKLSFEQR